MSGEPVISELTIGFARNHPAEMASFLAAEHPEALLETVLNLPEAAAAAVLSHLPQEAAAQVLGQIPDTRAAAWIAAASVAEALNIVLRLQPDRRETVLQGLTNKLLRHQIERLVVYPRRTLGALAGATAVSLNADTPLQEAVSILRNQADFDQQVIWVVDETGRFLGQLDLARALLANRADTRVRDCLHPLKPLLAESALLAAHDDPLWLQHLILPVVDYDGHLLGQVNREQLLAAVSEDTPGASGVGEAVASLATLYMRFLSTSLGDLLQGRTSR